MHENKHFAQFTWIAAFATSPANFIGAHFQKVTQISSLYDFHYILELISSLMYSWLLMTSVFQIWYMLIYEDLKNA